MNNKATRGYERVEGDVGFLRHTNALIRVNEEYAVDSNHPLIRWGNLLADLYDLNREILKHINRPSYKNVVIDAVGFKDEITRLIQRDEGKRPYVKVNGKEPTSPIVNQVKLPFDSILDLVIKDGDYPLGLDTPDGRNDEGVYEYQPIFSSADDFMVAIADPQLTQHKRAQMIVLYVANFLFNNGLIPNTKENQECKRLFARYPHWFSMYFMLPYMAQLESPKVSSGGREYIDQLYRQLNEYWEDNDVRAVELMGSELYLHAGLSHTKANLSVVFEQVPDIEDIQMESVRIILKATFLSILGFPVGFHGLVDDTEQRALEIIGHHVSEITLEKTKIF